MLTLQLPEEIKRRLHMLAKEQGRDPELVAIDILTNELMASGKLDDPNDLPYEVWRERFDAWIKSVPQVHTGTIDDSRETIYQGRGE
jgi:hypothetical protein